MPRDITCGMPATYPAIQLPMWAGTLIEPSPSQTSTQILVQPSKRLVSLDVLRGLTVALMILVNNAGDGKVSYAQLRHSVWNGCTLTDLVFPCFLFMVGTSIVLSFGRRTTRKASRGITLRRVLKRSMLIFLIGLFINALPVFAFSTLRYYGVLQRIAICYAAASTIYLFGGVIGAGVLTALCAMGYWLLIVHVRVPGYGMPGIDVPILDPSGNLAAWVDRLFMSPAHLYHHTVYDPEGLLSTISALATTLIGVLAGRLLQTSLSARRKAGGLLGSGLLMLSVGLLWSHWLPLNKRLWTSSYCLFTAGIATALLALLFYLIDGPPQLRRGLTPWLVFGTNALLAYIFSEVLAIALSAVTLSRGETLQEFIYGSMSQSLRAVIALPPSLTSLIWSILFVLVCSLPGTYLYRRKIFLKL